MNIFQLESKRLIRLILNSIKDSIGINGQGKSELTKHPKHMRSYKKACQRIYLAETLFEASLMWLDGFALRFRETQAKRNPISSSTEAPRLNANTDDLLVRELYFELKNVRMHAKR